MLDEQTLRSAFQGVARIDRSGTVTVTDAQKLRSQAIEALARHAIFAEKPEVREASRWLIRRIGEVVGVISASILPLYKARGRWPALLGAAVVGGAAGRGGRAP